jgi:hypothetical protein
MQDDLICLWAEVSVPVPKTATRIFRIVGTGGPVPEEMSYLGTVQYGGLVYHVYWDGA